MDRDFDHIGSWIKEYIGYFGQKLLSRT
jgi:hypothetical protein